MATVRKTEIEGIFTNYLCKDTDCNEEDQYMISVPVPGNAFWKEFYVDICIIPP